MSEFTSHETAAHETAALPVLPPARLVGRETVLAPVYAQLKAGKPVLVYGPAGIGKSALAATLANAYAQQPGGVLWFAVNNDSLESLLARVGRAYEITELMAADNPLALVGAVASTLTQHKPFIVLDGVLDAQVVSKFVTRCADRLPVLLLNREDLEGSWESIELPPLDAPNAVALFKLESGIAHADSDADIAEIVKVLGYLPFAIGIGARAMLASKQPPASYKGILAQVAGTTGGNPAQTALTASFSPLNGALQGVILILSAVQTGQASADFLSLIGGAPVESVQQAMNLLAGLKLVERTQRYGLPYYRLHTLTQAFAQERLRSSDRLGGLQDKVRDSSLAFVPKFSAGTDDDYNKLAGEMDNILAIARWAAQEGNRDIANQLVGTLTQAGSFVSERGYVYELLQLRAAGTGSRTAFPAYQEPEPEPASDVFSMLDSIGSDDVDEAFDDFDEDEEEEDGFNVSALIADASDEVDFEDDEVEFDDSDEFETFDDDDLLDDENDGLSESMMFAVTSNDITGLRASLARARQDNDRERQISLLRAIGKVQVNQSMHNEAIATYSEALTAYEADNDQPGMLEMLEMISALMQKTENSQAAVLNATRGVKLAEALGEAETQMQLLITLGDARQQLGESEQAATVYGQALTIARTRGDAQHEAIILYKLGSAQLDSGDAESAIDTLEQALAMFKTQGKRDYEGRVLGALGSAYGELERWSEAINFHMSALYIAREVKDREEESLQLSSLGYASIQAGQLGQAVLRYRQALHLAYQANNRSNIVSTLVDLVRLLARSPRHLSVSELLINDALKYDPNDKDVKQFKERVTAEKTIAAANSVTFVQVNGDAHTYASNAYRLLDE